MPDSPLGQSGASAWGHKIRLSVYVEGDAAEAQFVADRLLAAVNDSELGSLPAVDFIGCAVEIEHDAPRDQGGS